VLGHAQGSTAGEGWQLVFLHTDDGGVHWTSQVLPNPPGISSLQLVVAPGQSETMSCATALACTVLATPVNPLIGITWHTRDGGATWQVTDLGTAAAVNPSLTCPTVDLCWAGPVYTGGVGHLLESDDGGLSWTPVPLPAFPPRPQAVGGNALAPDISCVSSSQCVLSQNAIDVTTDGGTTWQQAPLPAGVGGLLQVSCAVGGSCIAIANPASGAPDPEVGSLILTDAPADDANTAGSTDG
jgi:photosystem II stability/assembly factor-like uncharacterized protein